MQTIKSQSEFNKVFSTGTRRSTSLLRLTYLKSEDNEGKLAFVAAKRLGNAVYRNKCKRLLRETARACGLPCQGYSLILFATDKTHDAKLVDLTNSLSELLKREQIPQQF